MTADKPSLKECKDALAKYMPEFVPLYEDLLKMTNADEELARMLSLYCPNSFERGCTQAAWTRYSPILVRNYDYAPELLEGRILKSKWLETEVIAMTDCLWGALDGINEHGLSVSLAYGVSTTTGVGFAITLVVRYVLKCCKNTQEAIEVLKRIPVNMVYNVTLLDAWNHVVTVELSPVEKTTVLARPFAVNHQGRFNLNSFAIFSNSEERERAVSELLFDPMVSIESFTAAFSYDPLFSTDYKNRFGTIYTAIYNPFLKATEYRWPGDIRIYQSFAHFTESEFYVSF
jgi:predicted choloylglycine hydrolase